MAKILLRARHWHLFLLTFGIPLILQLVFMVYMILTIKGEENLNASILIFSLILFPLVIIINMGVMFGWYWSVAIGLKNKIPEEVTFNYRRFKIFFFFPLIYISLFLIYLLSTFFGFTINPEDINLISLLGFVILVPLHLFAMFCMFYTLYFVAKTFKTVELQRKVTSSDYIGDFFLIWFFPIGLWFIQPKLNKIINQENESIRRTTYKKKQREA